MSAGERTVRQDVERLRALGCPVSRRAGASYRARGPPRTSSPVYVAEIGVDFTVLEPPEFAERVRRLAGRFARAVET